MSEMFKAAVKVVKLVADLVDRTVGSGKRTRNLLKLAAAVVVAVQWEVIAG